MICLECKEFMCLKCLGPHTIRGCKGAVMDLPSYAETNIVPQLQETLKDLESGKEKLKESTKVFTSMLPRVKKDLLMLKDKIDELSAEINNALALLEGCDPNFPYVIMESTLEQQLNQLKISVANDNMEQIIKAIESQKELQQNISAGTGDAELRLIEGINLSVRRLMETKEFVTLGECLQGLTATCQNIFKRKAIPEVASKFVYGTCNMIKQYTKLCRYDIVTKKIALCADVPQCCSVLQTGKWIFISGGGDNLVVDTLSEFIERTQSLVSKAPMKYSTRCHTMIAVSPLQFMTIGGYNGHACIVYCEGYSIEQNTWKAMPSLNQARCGACAALSGDYAYLYAIGGPDSNDIIERLYMNEKKVWEKVALSSEAEVPFNSYSAAFPISIDEIMIFAGNNSADCGIFNVKTGTVKKYTQSTKADSYYWNSVCIIAGDAYIMSSDSTHIHIYRAVAKKIEEIDYHNV